MRGRLMVTACPLPYPLKENPGIGRCRGSEMAVRGWGIISGRLNHQKQEARLKVPVSVGEAVCGGFADLARFRVDRRGDRTWRQGCRRSCRAGRRCPTGQIGRPLQLNGSGAAQPGPRRSARHELQNFHRPPMPRSSRHGCYVSICHESHTVCVAIRSRAIALGMVSDPFEASAAAL